MAVPLVDSTAEFVNSAYEKIEKRLEIVRGRLGRPLTFTEKVLLGHLDDPAEAELLPCLLYTSPSPRDRG